MWRNLLGLLFILMSLGAGVSAWGASSCEPCSTCFSKLETFRGRQVRVHELDPSRYQRGEFYLGDLFDDPKSELVFGWSHPAHAYLVTGNARFDGNFLYKPGNAQLGNNILDPGIFFRFKGLPQETVDQVHDEIKRIFLRQVDDGVHPASVTCVAGVCKILKAGGIEVAGRWNDGVLASRTFSRMIENGFVDAQGKPIEIEIYRTHPRSLENIRTKMKSFERDQVKDLKPFLVLATGTGGAVGVWIYAVANQMGQEKEY